MEDMKISFSNFRQNLPVEVSGNDQVIAKIDQIGRRVVAIKAMVPDPTRNGRPRLVKGSAIVFKANGDYYLQTADHCSEATEHLLVKFHFDHENTDDDQYAELRNNAFMGHCFERDKAIYYLNSITDALEEDPSIPDLGPLIVGIEINDRPGLKGFVECFKKGSQVYYCVHVPGSPDIPSSADITSLVFNNGTRGNPQTIEPCIPTSRCSRVILKADQVPDETKELFIQRLPRNLMKNTKVATISHPRGKFKKISWGNIILDGTNGPPPNPQLPPRSFKDVVFVKHSCDTAPGSSGGAVIVLGEDGIDQLGYTSYLAMHHRFSCHGEPGGFASLGFIN